MSPPQPKADADVVERVVAAGRALAAAGQQDLVWGHVALRDPLGRGIWIKASGWAFEEVTPERVLLVGWDGSRLLGDGAVHLECHIHLGILAARPEATASVHTHAPAVNAFSALELPMRAISHEGVLFADPQVPRSTLSSDLVANPVRGAQLAADLGVAPACLMPRHGLVAVGASEAAAVMHAVLLSAACAVQLQALSAGALHSWSDDGEIADKKAHAWPPSQLQAGYDYLVRAAGRRSRPPHPPS